MDETPQDVKDVEVVEHSPVKTTLTPAQKLAAAEKARHQLIAQHRRINHGQ